MTNGKEDCIHYLLSAVSLLLQSQIITTNNNSINFNAGNLMELTKQFTTALGDWNFDIQVNFDNTSVFKEDLYVYLARSLVQSGRL